MLDERAGLQAREGCVERQHECRVDTGVGELGELLIDARQWLRAQLGTQQAERIAVEGDGDDAGIRLGRRDARTIDHGAMPGVHAVELADRDDARAESGWNLFGRTEDDHQLDPSTAGSGCGSGTPWRWVTSHHTPTNGSTSGTQK